MPYHVLLDQYEEERLGGRSFGSTKSGIAPFYSDKYAKIGFQLAELWDDGYARDKLERVLEVKNVMLEHLYHKQPLSVDCIFDELRKQRDAIAPYVGDTFQFLREAQKNGARILLEGQLGAMKDPDFGIYPMVTSSSTLAAFGAIGAGVPPYAITDIVCVVKAYSSAVGAGALSVKFSMRRRKSSAYTAGTRANLGPQQAGPAGWAGLMQWPPGTASRCKARRKWL